MSRDPHVSAVTLTAASSDTKRTGLLGYVRFILAGIVLVDAVALRRTLDGRLTLSWPERRDRAGIAHPILRPVNDGARRILEAAVFDALGITPAEARDVP